MDFFVFTDPVEFRFVPLAVQACDRAGKDYSCVGSCLWSFVCHDAK